jgi:hypothetical protein
MHKKFLTKKVEIYLIFQSQIHEKFSSKRSNLWLRKTKRTGLRPLKDYKEHFKKRPSFKGHIKKKDAARPLLLAWSVISSSNANKSLGNFQGQFLLPICWPIHKKMALWKLLQPAFVCNTTVLSFLFMVYWVFLLVYHSRALTIDAVWGQENSSLSLSSKFG